MLFFIIGRGPKIVPGACVIFEVFHMHKGFICTDVVCRCSLNVNFKISKQIPNTDWKICIFQCILMHFVSFNVF